MTNFAFSIVMAIYNFGDYIREWVDLVLNQTFNFNESSIKNNKLLSKANKGFSLYLKRKDFHVEVKKNKVFLKTGNYVINKLHNHKIYFDVVDIKEDFINFTGTFTVVVILKRSLYKLLKNLKIKLKKYL